MDRNLFSTNAFSLLSNPVELIQLIEVYSIEDLRAIESKSNSKILLHIRARTSDDLVDTLERIYEPKATIYIAIDLEHSPELLSHFLKILDSRKGLPTVIYNVHESLLTESVTGYLSKLNILVYPYRDENGLKVYGKQQRRPFFDILLKAPTGLTYFEEASLQRLTSKIKGSADLKRSTAEIVSGFKIENSHMRIGSKIHITNFYFAKRFFQNSYFAEKFAYLISKTIIESHIPKIRNLSTHRKDSVMAPGLTILGYGIYAEMMVATVHEILNKCDLNIRVNHDVIKDEENIESVRPISSIQEFVILVIPISSTFSTSQKITDFIKKNNVDSIVVEPHLNLINVFDDTKRTSLSRPTPIEAKFRWNTIDLAERTIYLKTDDQNNNSQQRYFLRLPTTWHDVKDCKWCFSDPPTSEIPLFTTDKTSVTPILIFDMPKGRALKSHRQYVLTEEMLSYGHFAGHSGHNIYQIDREKFFSANITHISIWLRDLKNQGKYSELTTRQTIIISPGHYSNVSFTRMVNEMIFDGQATIIHYDVHGDHAQNFGIFFGPDVGTSLTDARLVFVDDMLVSGSTFSDCVSYLKYTRADYKGFNGCFTLIDRSNDFVQKKILSELDNDGSSFQSFAELLVSVNHEFNDTCPICAEKDRYENLLSISYLDKTQYYFRSQVEKLKLRVPQFNIRVTDSIYLRRIEATHRIYCWFFLQDRQLRPKIDKFSELSAWVEDVMLSTTPPFFNSELEDTDDELVSETFLKVLTQSPLTHYKPIRSTIFKWQLHELDSHSTKVIKSVLGGKLSFQDFRRLKFLIRRSGQLQSNYLISSRFFALLNMLFKSDGLPKLLSQIDKLENVDMVRKTKMLDSINSFSLFYAGQIKELLNLNEARSIRLEKQIISFLRTNACSFGFQQVLRILREENGILVNGYVNYIESNLTKRDYPNINITFDEIKRILESPHFTDHFRYQDLQEFLHVDDPVYKEQNLSVDQDLTRFLYIRRLLVANDSGDSNLQQKTGLIMDNLRMLILGDSLDGGALFTVIYKKGAKENLFFAHNKGNHGSIPEFRPEDTESYFNKFLRGIPDATKRSNLTITEFHRRANESWIDLYADPDSNESVQNLGKFAIPEEYNRIIMLRINKPLRTFRAAQPSYRKSQALICLYCKRLDDVPTSPSKIRYLLLLRQSFSSYVQSHYETNEFKDLVDAMVRRRTSLLTGHGRDMLMNIATDTIKSPINYNNILLTILLTQKTFLDEIDLRHFGKARDFVNLKAFLNLNNDVIDSKYCFEYLHSMASDIFDLNIIENKEDVEFAPIFSSDQFRFSKQILDCICFELFLNAKKNRYIFLQNDSVDLVDEKLIKDLEVTKIRSNRLWVEFSDLSKTEVMLKICNTGPDLPEFIRHKMETGRNIKSNEEIGGLEMISAILEKFSLGSLTCESLKIGKKNLSIFSVILTLRVIR